MCQWLTICRLTEQGILLLSRWRTFRVFESLLYGSQRKAWQTGEAPHPMGWTTDINISQRNRTSLSKRIKKSESGWKNLEQDGIEIFTTSDYTVQSNGWEEGMNRPVKKVIWNLPIHTGAPVGFWLGCLNGLRYIQQNGLCGVEENVTRDIGWCDTIDCSTAKFQFLGLGICFFQEEKIPWIKNWNLGPSFFVRHVIRIDWWLYMAVCWRQLTFCGQGRPISYERVDQCGPGSRQGGRGACCPVTTMRTFSKLWFSELHWTAGR